MALTKVLFSASLLVTEAAFQQTVKEPFCPFVFPHCHQGAGRRGMRNSGARVDVPMAHCSSWAVLATGPEVGGWGSIRT